MISKRFEFPGPWAAHEFFKLESLVYLDHKIRKKAGLVNILNNMFSNALSPHHLTWPVIARL